MRVLIDVSYAKRGPSGTGVYTDALVEALRAEGVDVIEAARRPRPRGGGGPRSVLNALSDQVWTHTALGRHARTEKPDVVHHPLPAHTTTAIPQVITAHDLAFERVPDCFDARFRRYARHAHRSAARHAAHVIVPSEATAADVRSRWAIPPEQITVAPHGPGQAIPAGNRGEARHFLYVGDGEPRKNLGRLLIAYAQYRETATEPLALILAGRGAPAADAPGVNTHHDPDLPELHRHAAALVIPSLHEGFGIPALEAMHAGTPVIAARTAGLAEVCGDAVRFCDPRDPASIADALADLAATPPLREELRRRGEARAAAFSWQRSARAHIAAYEAAVRSRQSA